MKHCVTGFLISQDRQSVVLIRKTAPAWQKGCLNGVGGKIETGEMPSDAMVREFMEEAGVKTEASHWKPFVRLTRPEQYIVHFFINQTDTLTQVRSIEEEPISIQPISAAITLGLSSLTYLLAMGIPAVVMSQKCMQAWMSSIC